MNNFIFEMNACNVAISNNLLMQLWATFLNKGKIGWQYIPYKNQNLISVGYLDIHQLPTGYRVDFLLKKEGVIKSVILTKQNDEQFTQQELEYLQKVNEDRKVLKKQIFNVTIEFSIDSFRGINFLYPFAYKNITLYCIEDRQYIDFSIKGFSQQQISEEILEIFEKIASFLATQTNSIVEIKKVYFSKKITKLSSKIQEINQNDESWMDDYPINNSHFILPLYAKEFLYQIANQVKAKKLNILLRASHHFKHSLQLNQKKMQKELIISQFMSSLETLAELENPIKSTCEACNQPIFSIKKRVLFFLEKYFPEHLVSIFANYYKARSKYLHEGKLIHYREYTGISLPQISEHSKSGCEDYAIAWEYINITEWIGWLIRKKAKEN